MKRFKIYMMLVLLMGTLAYSFLYSSRQNNPVLISITKGLVFPANVFVSNYTK